jgi:two-component system, NarL family, sensor histidine kinase DegS
LTSLKGSSPAADSRDRAGSAALASARFVVSERIADLDDAVAELERRIAESEAQRGELRERLERAEVIRRHVMNHFSRLQPQEVDDAFQEVLSLRVDLATVEERFRELGARVTDLRAGQEALRGVLRGLDDMAQADDGGAADGASRFRSASRQVFQIIEEERLRIARDMHDGPAQSMANLVLQAEVLEKLLGKDPQAVMRELNHFKSGVRDALDETRRLIFDLRPMTLDDLGLVPTLRKFVVDFERAAGVRTRLNVVGAERRLPRDLEGTVFRIVQEALTNARKHSGADNIDVTIMIGPQRVVASVRDNGRGFDVAVAQVRAEESKRLGLVSMRERAGLENGVLDITSVPGQGTQVRVSIDYEGEPAA